MLLVSEQCILPRMIATDTSQQLGDDEIITRYDNSQSGSGSDCTNGTIAVVSQVELLANTSW